MDERQVEVRVRGDVGAKDVRYARRKVARVSRWTGAPVMYAKVTLTAAGDPARERRALAQATLQVDRDIVRAHVAAHRMPEAADLLEERLREQMETRKGRRLAARRHAHVRGLR
jgi:ribosome-associated translation inhibitor RaiA